MTPTIPVSAKKLATIPKKVAEPPMTSVTVLNGVLVVSNAMEPMSNIIQTTPIDSPMVFPYEVVPSNICFDIFKTLQRVSVRYIPRTIKINFVVEARHLFSDSRFHIKLSCISKEIAMADDFDMRWVAPTVCGILGVRSPRSAETGPMAEVVGTMGGQERLAVVVIDALGVSTWEAIRMETPTFNTLANRHMLRLRSMMPTVTPVNFATMLTGASPDAHMIRDRTEKLLLETIFDVLREGGMASATAARGLSSLGMLISPHADNPGIAESNLDSDVTSITLKALREGADLLWVQLLDVDDAGHQYGPLSPQGIAAAHTADNHLREIAVAAHELEYGLIVLADHGQHIITRDDGSLGGWHGTDKDEDLYVPFAWCEAAELGRALGLATS